MTYDEIANNGGVGTPMEMEASNILHSITRYGGFDMAWGTTNYREEIFQSLVTRLEKISSAQKEEK